MDLDFAKTSSNPYHSIAVRNSTTEERPWAILRQGRNLNELPTPSVQLNGRMQERDIRLVRRQDWGEIHLKRNK